MDTNEKFTKNTNITPCGKCVFFVYEERGSIGKIGFCRLDPPQVVVVEGKPKTVLPVVRPELDGCGQGELAEF